MILGAVYRTFRRVEAGTPYVDQDLNMLLAGRGLLARLLPGAYGWAFIKPICKLYYNLTITFVSVVVAVVVGGIEALGLAGDQFGLSGPFWKAIAALNDHFGMIGYLIIAIFVVSWIAAAVIYRMRGHDQLEIETG